MPLNFKSDIDTKLIGELMIQSFLYLLVLAREISLKFTSTEVQSVFFWTSLFE